ncbi:MAG: hypothetical protein NZ951_03870 [Dehalococcoidia bacterium]|nr:hypothetical protein [Dehalococcoidia bacterium]MDW8120264.1 hypothetical protein [Chloroflexota bacterium]
MGVERYLQAGEKVLASCGAFHATDRRLIRYTDDPTASEPVQSLTYEQITGIRLGVRTRLALLFGGLGLALVGLLFPQPEGQQVFQTLALVLVVAGAGLVLYGFFTRKFFLEFRSPTLTKEQQALWRLDDTRSEAARTLARTVYEHIQKARKAARAQEQAKQKNKDSA